MWEYEDLAENMVVVVVPRILISVLHHNLFSFDIHNLKLLLFEVSNSQEIVCHTETKAISTETLGQNESYFLFLKYDHLLKVFVLY